MWTTPRALENFSKRRMLLSFFSLLVGAISSFSRLVDTSFFHLKFKTSIFFLLSFLLTSFFVRSFFCRFPFSPHTSPFSKYGMLIWNSLQSTRGNFRACAADSILQRSTFHLPLNPYPSYICNISNTSQISVFEFELSLALHVYYVRQPSPRKFPKFRRTETLVKYSRNGSPFVCCRRRNLSCLPGWKSNSSKK